MVTCDLGLQQHWPAVARQASKGGRKARNYMGGSSHVGRPSASAQKARWGGTGESAQTPDFIDSEPDVCEAKTRDCALDKVVVANYRNPCVSNQQKILMP